eukprot:TRINITY_DN17863_c0_g1_i1.p1 TRINITY_DN17863_c0_g1~~TRINITY_DN17863_c0_g1_i1.p1  ORF type:complete len:365 (+),score=44.95 TRINITY_DN17863_c0_g1_i1:106-1095(+)
MQGAGCAEAAGTHCGGTHCGGTHCGETAECPVCFQLCEIHGMVEASVTLQVCGDCSAALASDASPNFSPGGGMELHTGAMDYGCERCPQCHSLFALPANPPATAQSRLQCPRSACRYEFCPNCNEAPHPGHTCDKVRDARRLWLHWLAHGQRQWLETQTAGPPMHEQRQQLAKEAQKQLENMLATEAFLARSIGHCCPRCGALLVCPAGDYMTRCGGALNPYGCDPVNPDFGCGETLNWSCCPEYIPSDDTAAHQRLQEALAQQTLHRERTPRGSDCSGCGGGFAGVRFKCLTCTCTNLCVTCVQQRRGHDDKPGQPPHVFQILLAGCD